MKLQTNIQKLKVAVSQAEKVISKNPTHPVLGSILLETEHNILHVKATNLSLGIDIAVPSVVEKQGRVSVPGNLLFSILSSVSGKEDISIDMVENSISLTTSHTNLVLNTLPNDEFPSIPHVEGVSLVLPVSSLLKGLRSVYYSASVSDIKPEISSVYIYTENNDSLVFVATDTFRLAEKSVEIDSVPDFEGFLVPFKNISEIIRILGDYDQESVDIILSKNQISFQIQGMYLTSRLVDGLFPDYRQIFPKEKKTQVIILKQDLSNALKLANVFSDKFNQITLTIDPKEGLFEISSKNTNVGENSTNLIATVEGEPITVYINYKYLLDCFQSISSESLILEFTEQRRPIIIKGVSEKDFLYLIMPMNR